MDPSEGLVLCENIIDSQAYSNKISYYNNEYRNSTGAYASDYESSSIREWLNDEFYNTAFNSSQQSKIVKTHLENKSPYSSTYNSADTEDKVFLMSYYDVTNTNYGFASNASTYDVNRRAHSTDYAKCQGVYTYTGSSYQTADGEDTSYWWLRSPYSSISACEGIDNYGYAYYNGDVDYTDGGVRPALKISNLSSLISQSSYQKLEIEKDTNSFDHAVNVEKYYKAGFVDVKDYHLDNSYFKNLTKNSSTSEKSALKAEMNSHFNGVCRGIAMTIAMTRNGTLRLSDLTDQNVSSYYAIDKPCEEPSGKFLNVLKYFQLAQNLEKGGKDMEIAKTHGKILSALNPFSNSLRETLETIVSCAQETDKLYVLSFNDMKIINNWGHAMVLVDCVKENGKYKVIIFDENSVGNESNGEYSYMYIPYDFSSFTYEGIPFTDNYGRIAVIDTAKSINLDGKIGNYRKAAAKVPSKVAEQGERTTFSIVPQYQFTLKDSQGSKLIFDGENFSGDMPVYDVDILEKGDACKYVFEIDNSDIFTLDCSGKIDCSLGNDDTYFSVDGENISGVTFSADTMKLDGKNITFKAFVSTDEEVAENELGLVSISASSAAGVTLNKNNDCVEVTSDGDMSSIEAASYVGTEKETQTYDGKTDKITLTADDVIVAEKKVHSVSVDDVTLNYKKSVNLKPAITADEGIEYTVSYKSSDPKAASVDKDGNVKALKRGNATITVTVTDQYGNEVKDTCNVTVKYSILQWIIIIVLFGWLWY